MYNYVDVSVTDCCIILGVWDSFQEQRFCDGWVKTVDLELGEGMLLIVGYVGEPMDYFC